MFRVRVNPTLRKRGPSFKGMNAMVMITFPFLYDLVGNYPISVADIKKSRSEFNILYKYVLSLQPSNCY